jgi:hypothetical protein
MNPYLEQPGVWHDFHQRFVPRMGDALAAQIRPAYVTRIDDHIYIHELSADERVLVGRPDVSVSKSPDSGSPTTAGPAVVAPTYGRIPPAVDPIREPFIEIYDRETRKVVTVIELLSPTNKTPGSDREQYLGKRNVLLASNTHVVEIDLLRGGQRAPVRDMPTCNYGMMVSRSYERPRVELWPLALSDPLPTIPVPLRQGDADATLDLKRLFDEQYDAAGYEDYIYQTQPVPPLGTKERVWAKQFLSPAPKP